MEILFYGKLPNGDLRYLFAWTREKLAGIYRATADSKEFGVSFDAFILIFPNGTWEEYPGTYAQI